MRGAHPPLISLDGHAAIAAVARRQIGDLYGLVFQFGHVGARRPVCQSAQQPMVVVSPVVIFTRVAAPAGPRSRRLGSSKSYEKYANRKPCGTRRRASSYLKTR